MPAMNCRMNRIATREHARQTSEKDDKAQARFCLRRPPTRDRKLPARLIFYLSGFQAASLEPFGTSAEKKGAAIAVRPRFEAA